MRPSQDGDWNVFIAFKRTRLRQDGDWNVSIAIQELVTLQERVAIRKHAENL